MHHPTDSIAHTTAFVAPVVEHWLEREIAQWVHPMKDTSDDPSHHERTLLPRSYISLRGWRERLTDLSSGYEVRRFKTKFPLLLITFIMTIDGKYTTSYVDVSLCLFKK